MWTAYMGRVRQSKGLGSGPHCATDLAGPGVFQGGIFPSVKQGTVIFRWPRYWVSQRSFATWREGMPR